MHLGEGIRELSVNLHGGVKNVALKDKVDGVECGGGDEDGDSGQQSEACSETCGDACQTKAGAIETKHDDGCRDEPEEREQRHRCKHKGEERKACGDGSGEARGLDGTGPDDGVARCDGRKSDFGWGIRGSPLCVYLLVDLFAQILGELYLRSAAVPAEDKRALVFAMQDRVAAGADMWGHHFEGYRSAGRVAREAGSRGWVGKPEGARKYRAVPEGFRSNQFYSLSLRSRLWPES